MKNRYIFFKKLFPEHIIIFNDGKRLKSIKKDKILMNYMKNKDMNYIIVDNENNIEEYKCKKNNYKKYIIRLFLYDLLENMKEK